MKRLLIVLLLVPLAGLSAQKIPSIAPGTWVRIKAPSYQGALTGVPWLVGAAVLLSADTLVLKAESGDTLSIPLASIVRLEVRKKSRVAGAMMGAGIGLLGSKTLGGYGTIVGAGLSPFRWWKQTPLPGSSMAAQDTSVSKRTVSLTDPAGQELLPITPGARVRIKLHSWPYQQREDFISYSFWGTPRLVGSIVALNTDTLLLRVKDRASPLVIPLASVTQMEVQMKFRRTHALMGAGIGFYRAQAFVLRTYS